MVIRNDNEWTLIGFKRKNSTMPFRKIAYTLIDEDITYFSFSIVYNIPKRY